MKLKTYILSLVAVSMLFSCSDDSNDPTKSSVTLSLLTDVNMANTKANDDGITTLGVAVIYDDGVVKAYSHAPTSTTPAENKAELKEIPVKVGQATVVVFANVHTDAVSALSTCSTVDEVLNTLQAWDTELDGNFSMSSKTYPVMIIPGKNTMGYGATPAEGKSIHDAIIKLYRNVSRVQLTGLTLQKDTRYGEAINFKLDSIFLANVKGQTKLGSADAWGEIEATPADAANWLYGAFAGADQTGLFKSIGAGTPSNKLLYDATPAEGDDPFTVAADASWTATTEDPYLGKTFYVYENQSPESGEQTYLIVRGDYKMIENGKEITYYDRYWAIAVNNIGTSTLNTASEYIAAGASTATAGKLSIHKGIRRNHIYSINLTLTGRGSEEPYEPDATINLNAQILVNAWDRKVEVPGTVE